MATRLVQKHLAAEDQGLEKPFINHAASNEVCGGIPTPKAIKMSAIAVMVSNAYLALGQLLPLFRLGWKNVTYACPGVVVDVSI